MNPPKRRGCVSVIGYLAILFAASLVAAPSSGRGLPPTVTAQSGAPLSVRANRPAASTGQPEAKADDGLSGTPTSTPTAVRLPGVTGANDAALAPPRTASEPIAPSGEPTGEVGTAIYSASATWCAPTPTQCQSWTGDARLAAVNSFTWGDAPYWVRLWYGQEHADALVVSHCACNGEHGYIDVSPAVFEQLAPLSRGRINVAVEVLDWPVGDDPPPHPDDDAMRAEDSATLPPTDAQ